MEFEVFGIKADLAIRNQVYYHETRQMELYEKLKVPCVILVTCHRFEIYSLEKIDSDFLVHNYQEHPIEIYTYSNKEAYRHLLEVCCGLHSQIFGEDEIFHQVKTAYAFANLNQPLNKDLHRIFQTAFRFTKKIKEHYKIAQHPLSLSYITYQEIKKRIDLAKKVVLVIGSGQMAKQLVQNLKNEPIQGYLVSRNIDHAQTVVKDLPNFTIVPYKDRYEIAKRADLILSATAAPHLVLKPFEHEQPILAFDLASPSDIEKQLNIELYTLDDLARIAKENLELRKEDLAAIQNHIQSEIELFSHWSQQKKVEETLDSLQQKIQDISQETFAYLEHKLELNEREKKIVQKSIKAALFRLVKTPIQQLKNGQSADHETIKTLFDLEREKYEDKNRKPRQ